jgi:hypothetical protein
MNLRSLPLVLCLVSAGTVAAQPNDAAKTATKPASTNKSVKDPEAERIAKERRDNAQALLISLAADAGRFTDQTLRARTQARIADVLWSADPDRARAMFRKAWESAEIVDQEAQRELQQEMNQQQAKGGPKVFTGRPNIRNEVLRLAARRDRALGEEFLGKLRTERQQEATDTADKAKTNPLDNNTPEAISQRLTLARQLLDADVKTALQFADPALTNLSREAIDFLSYLREKDPAAADQRYTAFMARAAADLQSDANTVSLLSSYVFTPHTFVTFSPNGGASTSSTGRGSQPPDVPANLRAAFFRTAGDILMRPLAPAGQDQTSSGVQGKYLMLKRLMPLFEQYAPRETVEALNGQMQALASTVPEDLRARDDNSVREGLRPPQSKEDREKALRDRIDRAKTSEERDSLYIELARLYVENGDIRARDFVDKVDDSETRKQARSFFDASLIIRAIDKKDVDTILDLLRTADINQFQKTYALLQAAKLLVKIDREKAIATIEEANLAATKIEQSDADRPKALFAVANAWLVVDRPKAWDAVYEAIKAASAAEAFTGEDGVMRTTLQYRQSASIRSTTVSDFNVSGIFTDLANEDYNRTVELARGFEKEAPRASATIAIAKAVLEEKKP